MPDETDAAKQPYPDGFTRQTFIKLGLCSLGVAGAGAAVFGYEFLSPNVLYEPSPVVNAGRPERYPQGSVTADPKAGIYIVHGPEGFYALSAICTHLGCMTMWSADQNQIACPCHGSKFNLAGIRTDGPAPRPLPWLKITISDEGDLMIDRSTTVPPRTFQRT